MKWQNGLFGVTNINSTTQQTETNRKVETTLPCTPISEDVVCCKPGNESKIKKQKQNKKQKNGNVKIENRVKQTENEIEMRMVDFISFLKLLSRAFARVIAIIHIYCERII